MKNINIEEVVLVKEYLTNAEINGIIKMCIEAAGNDKNKDFENYRFSPLTLHTAYYMSLFKIIIKDYDENDYETYYSQGMHEYLIDTVINAYEGFVLLKDVYEEMRSVANIIDINIQELKVILENKIPDKKTLGKWLNKLPEVTKEFGEISAEHAKIMQGNTNKEGK